MPRYRIHRIKEMPRETFRWAPHTGGEATVKPKDYEAGRIVDASTPYAAWKLLADEDEGLAPGDVLEVLGTGPENEGTDVLNQAAELLIVKYIGFEPARWFVPEPRRTEGRPELPSLSSEPPAVSAT